MSYSLGGGLFGQVLDVANTAEERRKQAAANIFQMMDRGFMMTPEAEAGRSQPTGTFSSIFGSGPDLAPGDFQAAPYHPVVAESESWRQHRDLKREEMEQRALLEGRKIDETGRHNRQMEAFRGDEVAAKKQYWTNLENIGKAKNKIEAEKALMRHLEHQVDQQMKMYDRLGEAPTTVEGLNAIAENIIKEEWPTLSSLLPNSWILAFDKDTKSKVDQLKGIKEKFIDHLASSGSYLGERFNLKEYAAKVFTDDLDRILEVEKNGPSLFPDTPGFVEEVFRSIQNPHVGGAMTSSMAGAGALERGGRRHGGVGHTGENKTLNELMGLPERMGRTGGRRYGE